MSVGANIRGGINNNWHGIGAHIPLHPNQHLRGFYFNEVIDGNTRITNETGVHIRYGGAAVGVIALAFLLKPFLPAIAGGALGGRIVTTGIAALLGLLQGTDIESDLCDGYE